jgi:hypothetical protein
MQKWLNDLYAQILKNGFNPGGGGGGGGSHSGGGQGVLVGKYLGDTYTDTQKQAIANGTFEGLNIGDYWTFNGENYRIADFDYYYNVGDTAFTKHHVVVVPDTVLYNAQMNSTSTVTGCYSGSEMYTTNLNDARTAFDNAFGRAFIPNHRGLYSTSVSGGKPDKYAWRDMRVELMNEEQILGHAIWGTSSSNGYDVGTQKTQFRLFVLDKTKINIRSNYWLTNIYGSTGFVYLDEYGGSKYVGANNSYGVRPFACIVGDPEE